MIDYSLANNMQSKKSDAGLGFQTQLGIAFLFCSILFKKIMAI